MKREMKSESGVLRGVVLASALVAGGLLIPRGGVEAQDWCGRWSGDGERVCQERDLTLEASGELEVDGRENGGVSVVGADIDRVEIEVRIQAWSRDDGIDPQEVADRIEIRTDGARVRAEGPSGSRRSGWSVSYEIRVPHDYDLDLRATNGGISLEEIRGRLRFRTTNGGVHLEGVAGDVQGRTVNGGLDITLTGDQWQGERLDVETTNGGVVVRIPEGYSADFTTGTVNGGMEIDFPVTVRGRINRRLETVLGDGGAPVSVTTTNGGVRIERR